MYILILTNIPKSDYFVVMVYFFHEAINFFQHNERVVFPHIYKKELNSLH